MQSELQNLLSDLKKEGKNHLAEAIEGCFDSTVSDYSHSLFNYSPARPLEPELLEAFRQEFERLELSSEVIEKSLSFLQKKRVIQTAPHMGLVQSPRMLLIDWLATVGLETEDMYLVGLFSGIPFSNSSVPGTLSYSSKIELEDVMEKESVAYATLSKSESDRQKDSTSDERRISLFPATMQDTLVYRSEIPAKMIELLPSLQPSLQSFFPIPNETSFTKYACQAITKTQKHILKKENIIYFDICEVITNYLIRILDNDQHILTQILLDPALQQKIQDIFGDEIWFYAPYYRGKYEKQESLFYKDTYFYKGKDAVVPLNKETLQKELREGKLCPATLLTFTILSFLNHTKCLGSFRQTEYLPDFQEKWIKTNILTRYNIESVPVKNLTTGMLSGNHPYPLNILLGEPFNPEAKTVGDLLLPMKNILLS